MADETQQKKISLDELMVSTLAMTAALAKLLNSERPDYGFRVKGATQH